MTVTAAGVPQPRLPGDRRPLTSPSRLQLEPNSTTADHHNSTPSSLPCASSLPLEMAPPIVSVNSLAEAQDLPSNVTPRRIDLLALDAVRDAPPVLEIVRIKVEAGWSCPELPRLGKVARFAELLSVFVFPAYVDVVLLPLCCGG